MSGQIRSPEENITPVPYDTCFTGHLRCSTSIVELIFALDPMPGQVKVKMTNFEIQFKKRLFRCNCVSGFQKCYLYHVQQSEMLTVAFHTSDVINLT